MTNKALLRLRTEILMMNSRLLTLSVGSSYSRTQRIDPMVMMHDHAESMTNLHLHGRPYSLR